MYAYSNQTKTLQGSAPQSGTINIGYINVGNLVGRVLWKLTPISHCHFSRISVKNICISIFTRESKYKSRLFKRQLGWIKISSSGVCCIFSFH